MRTYLRVMDSEAMLEHQDSVTRCSDNGMLLAIDANPASDGGVSFLRNRLQAPMQCGE